MFAILILWFWFCYIWIFIQFKYGFTYQSFFWWFSQVHLWLFGFKTAFLDSICLCQVASLCQEIIGSKDKFEWWRWQSIVGQVFKQICIIWWTQRKCYYNRQHNWDLDEDPYFEENKQVFKHLNANCKNFKGLKFRPRYDGFYPNYQDIVEMISRI